EHFRWDAGGKGGRQSQRGREQGLGDARRHHREIGGMRFRDADEAVHDAPDRPEQADERRSRADCREHAGAAQDAPRVTRFEAVEARADAFLDAFFLGGAGGAPQFARSSGGALAGLAWNPGAPPGVCEGGVWAGEFSNAGPSGRRPKKTSFVLASRTVQVTTGAKARPINTAFTTGSALRYMPQGLRSRGSVAV